MAVTINDIIGLETSGLEEANATSGSPDATETTVVRSGTFSLAMNATADQYDIDPLRHIASAGTGYVFGFGFFATDKTPASDTTICIIGDSSDSDILNLVLEADGDIVVNDNTGATTITDPLTEGVWNFIELFWNHVNSGSWELFVDGSSVGSASTRDMSGGGTLDLFGLRGTATGTFYFDDIYLLSGATASSDALGDAEVFKYQSVKASQTPDDGGDVLDTGNWSAAGETPLDNSTDVAVYSSAGGLAGAVDTDATNGSPEGPKNDDRIDGDSNIRAIKGIWNMKRSGGGGTDHFGLLGNDGDGAARTADFAPTTSYVNKFHLTEASGGAAGDIPLSTEYIRIGFETTGGQDFNCGDMWAMLLHVPTAPSLSALSNADFPNQNYYVGPFEI